MKHPNARRHPSLRRPDLHPAPRAPRLLAALTLAGLPTDRFLFAGFVAQKQGERKKLFAEFAKLKATLIFFESPHRLESTLALLARIAPSRLICVARELTKKFEEYRRGTSVEVAAHYLAHPAKGEICLLIAGVALPKWAIRAAGAEPASEGETPD